MLFGCVSALAETTIKSTENRKIKIHTAGTNAVEEGVSPTTGLYLDSYEVPAGFAGLAANGQYTPILVQIDNSDGGVTYSDSKFETDCAPWGLTYADIIYETPLYEQGMTRLSALFVDTIPDAVGPVRSSRVGHAWLREEWGAGFVFWGKQKYAATNVENIFKATGASKLKYVLFDGTNGGSKPWLEYMQRRSGIAAPHNAEANIAALTDLLPDGYNYPDHAFLFTDDLPEGDTAETINVHWYTHYDSQLVYDYDSNAYYRYISYPDDVLIPYEARDTQQQLSFANVIVQWTDVEWSRTDAPIAKYLPYNEVKDGLNKYKYKNGGEGNADIFMGGVHIAGYWVHDKLNTRTVFYGADGNEVALQRGKTLIITLPLEKTVSYE